MKLITNDRQKPKFGDIRIVRSTRGHWPAKYKLQLYDRYYNSIAKETSYVWKNQVFTIERDVFRQIKFIDCSWSSKTEFLTKAEADYLLAHPELIQTSNVPYSNG